ncbi:iron-containing redox enzyme family protein [Aeromicrobium phragmitis]|uniref:iron-containing redox enzyme family protein n=1 Tax=Aeromicrobium phragmitis TaxID=2478914 RepID=UPI001FB771E5|nr:iron-containing redox enzyme family protein [Aeromicrobium phragmitis]
MVLPAARGRLSEELFAALAANDAVSERSIPRPDSPDDEQIALWALYELHYRGFDEVDADREWDPDLLRLRRDLERSFEERLRTWVSIPEAAGPVSEVIEKLIAVDDAPSIARFVQRRATGDQVRTVLQHRSIYHLKESDPVSWIVPRLEAGPKAALAGLQFDEYGSGQPSRLHHRLFADGLRAAELDDTYGRYIDEAPVEILELNNAMSLFGLHRRWRGAGLGHLAVFEATSSLPSRQMAQGLRRLGFPEPVAHYYDEHVEADAVHEQLALRLICDVLVEEEPDQRDSVLFGAATCLELEARYARKILRQWDAA